MRATPRTADINGQDFAPAAPYAAVAAIAILLAALCLDLLIRAIAGPHGRHVVYEGTNPSPKKNQPDG